MKKLLISILVFLLIPIVCLAAPPEKPAGEAGSAPGGAPGGNNTSVTHSGNTKISKNGTFENKTYNSSKGGQNSLLVSSSTVNLKSCKINKTGSSSDENSDFYGTNAAIFVYEKGVLNITGGEVTTDGGHANAVFAYDSGTINITDTKINTTSNNSGAIMVTGGGTINATNVTAKTKGNSSAPIRSDRGGGSLTVNKGTYEANGVGSPAIYSTAKIIVNDAKLISTASEGAVVEGANSIELNNVTLTDNNTKLNGQSETYKNIFLYQSMSGDADEGTASFTAKDSTFETKNGDDFFVTNTTATITLENNTFNNKNGSFLRIQEGKWGNTGSNGGNVTLNATNQKINGNIIVDSISTLNMSLKSSFLKGAINKENQAKKLVLSLTSDSTIVLTADSYVDALKNEISDNANIYANGHSLYVDNEKVSINTDEYSEDITTLGNKKETNTNKSNTKLYIGISAAIISLILIIIIAVILKKRNN